VEKCHIGRHDLHGKERKNERKKVERKKDRKRPLRLN
jgi:hypothetical protein